MNKMDELLVILEDIKPDIIGLTETWAFEEIQDSELHLDGYNMFRQDRTDTKNGRGGGVLLYMNERIKSTIVDDYAEVYKQCDILVTKRNTLRLGVVYRSPNSSEENDQKMYIVHNTRRCWQEKYTNYG